MKRSLELAEKLIHQSYLEKEEYMTDYQKLAELSGIIASKKEVLTSAYEEWERLSEESPESD